MIQSKAISILVLGALAVQGCGPAFSFASDPSQVNSSEPTDPERAAPPAVSSRPDSPPILLFSNTDRAKDMHVPSVNLTPEKEQQLLHSLFGDFLSDRSKCPENTDWEQARRMGQFVPAIVSSLKGSFVAKGEQELLLLVKLGECGVTHADNRSTFRLVVLDGERAVLNEETDATSLAAAMDVNRDGLLDIVLDHADFQSTQSIGYVYLASLAGGVIQPVQGFGQTPYTINTEAGSPRGPEALDVWVQLGPVPSFKIDKGGDATPTAPSRFRTSAEALRRVRGDLIGDAGLEEVILYRDGLLAAGSLHGMVDMNGASCRITATCPFETGSPQGAVDMSGASDHTTLRVVDLDRARGLRGVLVTLVTDDDEDPPNRYQLFVPAKAVLRRILNVTPGVYGSPESGKLKFSGDGTVRYLEDGWSACERAGLTPPPGSSPPRYPTAALEEVVLGLQKDGLMAPTGRELTSQMQVCYPFAACPFVYVMDEHGAANLIGEILRDLRGVGSYASQTLALPLPARTDTALHVRLAEAKPEVTHLDQIFVEIDGVRVAPKACAGSSSRKRPAYCSADRRAHVLREGDTLDLRFELPSTGGRPVLHASGYYVPTPDPTRMPAATRKSAPDR